MLKKVKKWIERHGLLVTGDKVIIACSGGPDSLALVKIMQTLSMDYNLELAVAHVNHMFRGAESDADAAFVAEFCAKEGLPLYSTTINVPQFIATSGRSPEDAARFLRYRYLRETAQSLGGAKIATGHHRDDQAETVLINLLRGTGATGLSGMWPVNNGVIRPLLNICRKEIEEYCQEQHLAPRLDSTNLTTDYLRNYVRIELMPLLKNKFNANLPATLCRTASVVGDDQEFINHCVEAVWGMVVRDDGTNLELDCRELNKLHIALKREIIRAAIKKKRGTLRGITFSHVEKLVELGIDGQTGKVIELPGDLVACKKYGIIILKNQKLNVEVVGIHPPGVEVKLPGITCVSDIGIEVMAQLVSYMPKKMPECAVFDWQKITPPLYVRTRHAGDRFWPSGMPGSKKLKDFFIDAKVPREARDAVPILCDGQGILWVGGYRQTERAMPDKGTKSFLYVTINIQGSWND